MGDGGAVVAAVAREAAGGADAPSVAAAATATAVTATMTMADDTSLAELLSILA